MARSMFRILFWNVNWRPLHPNVARLVLRHRVDLILLAESSIPPERILCAIGTTFWCVPTECTRIQMFTRIRPESVRAVRDAKHFAVRRFNSPRTGDLLLVAVHSQASCA